MKKEILLVIGGIIIAVIGLTFVPTSNVGVPLAEGDIINYTQNEVNEFLRVAEKLEEFGETCEFQYGKFDGVAYQYCDIAEIDGTTHRMRGFIDPREEIKNLQAEKAKWEARIQEINDEINTLQNL